MKLLYKIPFCIISFTLFISCSDSKKETKPIVQDIPVVEVIVKDVPIYDEFVGQAYGLQDIPIRARVEGFLEGIHFNEGELVKKGQLLYVIDAQPFLAQVATRESEVAEVETRLINAQNELARYEPLVKINAISKSDYDAAVARRDAAEASLDAANSNLDLAKINLSYTELKAPINGLIGKTEAQVGEFVGREPNPVILNTVSNIDRIRVQFFLTESQYLTLIRNYTAKTLEERQEKKNINIRLILTDGSLYPENGTIDFLNRDIDPKTGSMLVQASFPNPNNILRPGMFAKVKVETKLLKDALLIPQRCVIELQGQFSVFAVDENNKVQSRQVSLGDKVGDLWLVKDGLKKGDKIVIDALQKVASGMQVNPQIAEFKSQTN